MSPIVHIQLTGKSILIILAALGVLAGTLAVVWLLLGPMAAIAGGLIVIVVIRGLLALFH
jgi:hypothetical protein